MPKAYLVTYQGQTLNLKEWGLKLGIPPQTIQHRFRCGVRGDALFASPNRQSTYKHGHSRKGGMSPTYKAWAHMKARCLNPNNKNYKDYGGRGIKVCDRWVNSFEAFLEDMGERPRGMTLDRIEVNKGYYPGNCRWASWQTQLTNRRDNRFVTIKGESRHLAEWARIIGITHSTLRHRLAHGWSDDDLLLPPGAKPRKTVDEEVAANA